MESFGFLSGESLDPGEVSSSLVQFSVNGDEPQHSIA